VERYSASKAELVFTHSHFHYNLESIHPFEDGNGRVGRLVLFREMLKHGLVPPIIREDWRGDYLSALKKYQENNYPLYRVVCQSQELYLKQIEYFFGGIPVGLEPPLKQYHKSEKAFSEWLDKRELTE